MSRPPSTETQLKNAQRTVRSLSREVIAMRSERDAYCRRAARAEQAIAEWKKRFDALLKLMGEPSGDKQ